MKAKISDPG